MVLRKGCKQTEIGVIPEDWELMPLSSLTTLMTNGFVGTAKTHYTEQNDGVLYIQGYNVEENDFNFNGIKRVTATFHKQHKKSCLREGDLLTVQTGDVGLTTYIPKELVNSNCHALIITRFKNGKYVPKYFSYYLNSKQGRDRLREIETGTTMKHINVGDMLHYLVPFPSTKTEQTAIANALSDADAWIQSLTHLIAKKRQIKQGAMQTLLNPYENSRLKAGWVVKKIGCFTDATAGGTPSTLVDAYWNGDIKWMSSGELNNKKIYDVSGRITIEGLNNSATKKIPEKCILIGLAGQGKTRGTVAINYVEVCTNQSIAAIYPCSTVSSEFLYFNLDGRYDELRSLSTGDSGRGGLNLTIIKNIDVWMPENIDEQTRIANILTNMDTNIAAHETKLTKTQQIKQGMMQNLLTGRIRLL